MTDTPEAVRLQVWEAADYQGCSLVHPRNGRCARGGTSGEVHHIEYRSGGGTDDPRNLLLVCNYHHRKMKGHAKLRSKGETYLIRQGEGPELQFVEMAPDGPELVAWDVWPNVKKQWEWDAERHHTNGLECLQTASENALQAAYHFAYVYEHGLLSVHECASIAEYAELCMVSSKTMYGYIAVGSFLGQMGQEEREFWFQLPYSQIRDRLSVLRSLPTEVRRLGVELLLEAETKTDLEEIIEELKGSPDGQWLYDVAVALEGTAHWRVHARDKDEAEKLAKRNTLGWKPGRPRIKGDPHTIEIRDVYAQRVEPEVVDTGPGIGAEEIEPSAASQELLEGDEEEDEELKAALLGIKEE